ncbi:hypothetical protein IG631_16229 [Alternaria alternata]|nr:hypothetical protein IG631_16229 [Alternaria alternata]
MVHSGFVHTSQGTSLFKVTRSSGVLLSEPYLTINIYSKVYINSGLARPSTWNILGTSRVHHGLQQRRNKQLRRQPTRHYRSGLLTVAWSTNIMNFADIHYMVLAVRLALIKLHFKINRTLLRTAH